MKSYIAPQCDILPIVSDGPFLCTRYGSSNTTPSVRNEVCTSEEYSRRGNMSSEIWKNDK